MRCLSRNRPTPARVTRPKTVKDNCFAAFFSRPFPLMSRANGVEIAIITEPFSPAGAALPPILGADQEHSGLNTGLSPQPPGVTLGNPKNARRCDPCGKYCHSLLFMAGTMRARVF